MNIENLMINIEKYFGKYENQIIKKAVEKFIIDNWDQEDFQDLLNNTIKNYSTQYKTQPDVEFFNKLWNKYNSIEDKADKVWNDLLEMKTSRKVLITDIVAQETIKSMGGIDDFIDYRIDNNHWCRKDFIERYVRLYRISKDIQPEILINGIEKIYPTYPRNYSDVKIIGDYEKGQLILGDIESGKIQIGYKRGGLKQIGDVMKNILD